MSKNNDDGFLGLLFLGVLIVGGIALFQGSTINEQQRRLEDQNKYRQYLEDKIANLERRLNDLQFNFYLNLNQLDTQIKNLEREVNSLRAQIINDAFAVQHLERVLEQVKEIRRRKQEALQANQ